MQEITDPVTLEFIQRQQRADFWNNAAQWGYTAWYAGFAFAVLLTGQSVLKPVALTESLTVSESEALSSGHQGASRPARAES